LLLAAASDIATMTIPNWISIAIAASFVPAALAAGLGPAQVGAHLLFAAAVLAVGIWLFSLGLIGGGDIKVIAAIAAWTGTGAFLAFLGWTLAAGGVLAAALLAVRQIARPGLHWPRFVNRLLEKRNGAPYAVAIAVGGLVALPAAPVAARLVAHHGALTLL
jgi:prepilin peptidase CpaA